MAVPTEEGPAKIDQLPRVMMNIAGKQRKIQHISELLGVGGEIRFTACQRRVRL